MDKETAKYVKRVKNRTGISSDGVPNGKGGSYPNYPTRMKYELPFGYTPLGAPSEEYREGHEATFGAQADRLSRYCPRCDLSPSWCKCTPESSSGRTAGSDPADGGSNPSSGSLYPRARCSACGKIGEHRVAPGILSCES